MEFKEGDLVKYKNIGLFKFSHYANKYKKWCVIKDKESVAVRTHHIKVPTNEDVANYIALKLKG
jgi:hypothetical protein